MSEIRFSSVLIVGTGLIGSSIARAIKENNISRNIFGIDTNVVNLNKCLDLKILNDISINFEDFSQQFDLIIIASPLSTYKKIFEKINILVNKKTLLIDVGSTKMSTIKDFKETVYNKNINL